MVVFSCRTRLDLPDVGCEGGQLAFGESCHCGSARLDLALSEKGFGQAAANRSGRHSAAVGEDPLNPACSCGMTCGVICFTKRQTLALEIPCFRATCRSDIPTPREGFFGDNI